MNQTELDDLRRKALNDPVALVRYVRRMIGAGQKIRLKTLRLQDFGLRVRTDYYGDRGYYVWRWSPRSMCSHKHADTRVADKCAKRWAYRLVVTSDDPEILRKYVIL